MPSGTAPPAGVGRPAVSAARHRPEDGPIDPVSATSAALLRLESPRAHLHVGWLARLEPAVAGAFDVDGLRARIGERLVHTPRLRQVVTRHREPAGERLVWEDDGGFALDRHVTVWTGAAAGEDELRAVVDGFVGERLDRARPLWRVLVVPHTRAGGAAIVGKLHRALADGNDAGLLRELVFEAGAPAHGAHSSPAVRDAVALDELREAHRMHAYARVHAGDRIGATLRRAAIARTEGTLAAAPPSSLNGPVGARRTLVTARTDLARLMRLADHSGTTLHDVVLTVVAGTLRRIVLASGGPLTDLRALVPLAIGEDELLGDTPCAVLSLPLGEPRPSARLAAVHAAMAAALRSPAPDPAAIDADPAPTLLAGPPEELACRLAIGSRLANVTLPSARVSTRGLHAGGVRVRALFPVSPAPDEHALALSTLSYDRHLHLGAAADTGSLPAIGRLPVLLADAVQELGVSTGVDRAGPRARAPANARGRRR